MNKEEELLYRCFQGESAAWEIFVNLYVTPINNSIKYILNKYDPNYSDSELEDLTQGVLVSLMEQDYKRLRLFRGERNCSLVTYLRVVAARQTVDYLRKKGREKNLLHHYKTIGGPEMEEGLGENVLSLVDEALEIEKVKEIIAGLSSQERLFIQLHFYRELSLKTTAEVLNISPEAAYTRKNRLIKKFRRLLEEITL